MIRPSLMLTAALLAGCDQFDPDPPKRVTDVSTITIDVDPQLETPGWAEWRGNVCRITLRRYPECLAHEVRHCFEHDWHPGRRTGEDC
jgi:hypothetical protein